MNDQLTEIQERCVRIETKLSRLMLGKEGLGPDTLETWNSPQQIVLRSYCSGEFSHVRTMGEVRACGDGLFTFLMVELSAKEDCTGALDAFNRVAQAIGQLREVLMELDSITEGV